MQTFLLVTELFFHIESCVIASIKSFIQVFISVSYTDKLGAIYGDVMTKKHENLRFTGAFSSLITISVLMTCL